MGLLCVRYSEPILCFEQASDTKIVHNTYMMSDSIINRKQRWKVVNNLVNTSYSKNTKKSANADQKRLNLFDFQKMMPCNTKIYRTSRVRDPPNMETSSLNLVNHRNIGVSLLRYFHSCTGDHGKDR